MPTRAGVVWEKGEPVLLSGGHARARASCRRPKPCSDDLDLIASMVEGSNLEGPHDPRHAAMAMPMRAGVVWEKGEPVRLSGGHARARAWCRWPKLCSDDLDLIASMVECMDEGPFQQPAGPQDTSSDDLIASMEPQMLHADNGAASDAQNTQPSTKQRCKRYRARSCSKTLSRARAAGQLCCVPLSFGAGSCVVCH